MVDEAPSTTHDEGGASETLAREIKHRRRAAGLSQPQLAQRIGYTRQYVSLAERVGQNLPSPSLVQALDRALDAQGALIALRNQAKNEQHDKRRQISDTPFVNEPLIFKHEGLVEARKNVGLEKQDTNHRNLLKALGLGAASASPHGWTRDIVLEAAHSSALLNTSIQAHGLSHRVLNDVRGELAQLATDYALTSELKPIFRDLVVLRDHLAAVASDGHRPAGARDLYQLLGGTCALLASVSHDLSEPRAGMVQADTAETFAKLSGDRALMTWVACTKAMIASWWGTPSDVLHHTAKARTCGLVGISAIRLMGLESRALAELGRRAEAIAVMREAEDQRARVGEHDGLGELGAVFSFSSARQHYYNATAYRHLGSWEDVEHEVGKVIDIYGTPSVDTWPVTLTLSRIYQAQARLHVHGPEGASDALRPVFVVPVTPRLPQTAQALGEFGVELRSGSFATLPAARDLSEAILAFMHTEVTW